MDTDYNSTGLLITCYNAVGDRDGVRRSAEATFARAEKAVAQDQSNGSALGYGTVALAALGEGDRAREWARRALLIDPENLTMRYNLACGFASALHDANTALEILEPCANKFNAMLVTHFEVDPDIDPIRNDPRFQVMLVAMKERIAASKAADQRQSEDLTPRTGEGRSD